MKQAIVGCVTLIMVIGALVSVDVSALTKVPETECPGGYSPGACIVSSACEYTLYRTCKSDGTWSMCHFECMDIDGLDKGDK